MFVAQAKFPEGRTKTYDAKKQEVKYPKTVLQSLDNPTRMAKESTRARLIHQLIEPQDSMPREFSSYFLGDTGTSDPTYLVTSHASDIPMQSPVVPVYPVQTLRWNPYVETSSIPECETQVQVEAKKEMCNVATHKVSCKCRNCTNLCCPSRTLLRQPEFKNNIMTFCDKCTMTLKLSSAGCGGLTPISCTPVISQASVTSSDVAVRDTMDQPYRCPSPQCIRSSPSRYHVDSHCIPPILKKPLIQSSLHNQYDYTTRSPILMDMEAERDIPDGCYPEAPCWKDKERDQLYARKSGRTLYNEGIIEEGDNFEPFCPRRRRSASVKREKSRESRVSFSSFFSKYDDDAETVIPHSHRHDSKYHYACMEQPHKFHRSDNDEDRRGLVASPKITRRSFQSVQQCKPTAYVLPKRVLTSNPDYNIEKFLQHNCCRLQKPKRKKCFSFFK
ncbi:uncharacterized protein [Choristoneura fumiferana]|uniref:uncharacterized protein n=1 Tax=Choristoneura fumiferana TaxID=7141 RepID=UPI003D15B427